MQTILATSAGMDKGMNHSCSESPNSNDLVLRTPTVLEPTVLEKTEAVISAWLPGSEGQGMADVIFGDYDFEGKLPFGCAVLVFVGQCSHNLEAWELQQQRFSHGMRTMGGNKKKELVPIGNLHKYLSNSNDQEAVVSCVELRSSVPSSKMAGLTSLAPVAAGSTTKAGTLICTTYTCVFALIAGNLYLNSTTVTQFYFDPSIAATKAFSIGMYHVYVKFHEQQGVTNKSYRQLERRTSAIVTYEYHGLRSYGPNA
ncbi:hypothetical protein Bca52824_023529 [Brassica carinata]|uniref:Glycoside hydrolase family 3 C-terminal domain-containing protein n=1 Tax=Brassica carinata TaxID=52824 RepID=A0A8X7VIQ0_BRACI|nr:hypothetical protein Bca52824_023529 [Brassica carinata]